jgi:hypothetical protein
MKIHSLNRQYPSGFTPTQTAQPNGVFLILPNPAYQLTNDEPDSLVKRSVCIAVQLQKKKILFVLLQRENNTRSRARFCLKPCRRTTVQGETRTMTTLRCYSVMPFLPLPGQGTWLIRYGHDRRSIHSRACGW